MVKGAGLKILWLSAFVGSNPTPCIYNKLKIPFCNKNKLIIIKRKKGKLIELELIIIKAQKISIILTILKFITKISPFINKTNPQKIINTLNKPKTPYNQKIIAIITSIIPSILISILFVYKYNLP